MILLLPEAKHVVEKQGRTKPFRAMRFAEDAAGLEALELCGKLCAEGRLESRGRWRALG